MAEAITLIHCDHVGVAGTTDVAVKFDGQEYEARVGIAILGSTQLSDEELERLTPFDDEFYDNYASGVGATQDEAVEAMRQDMRSIADSIWAE